MKTIFKIAAFVLSAILLCSCSKNIQPDGTGTTASNPFSTSQTAAAPDSTDYSYDNAGMGFSYDNWSYSFENEGYTGGDITISFEHTAEADGIAYAEAGIMVYLGGVPQLISFNGGEKTEMPISRLENAKSENVTITFTPRITEDMKDEETLQLYMFQILKPLNAPDPESDAVGLSRSGSLMSKRTVSIKSPVEEIIDDEKVLDEYEEVLITNVEIQKYKITGDVDRFTRFNMYPVDGETELVYCLPEGESSLELDMVIFGKDNYKYRIYFYQNNKRVKINSGYDCLDIDLKSGNLDRCRVKFDNLSNRDILFAVAVPLNAPEDSWLVNKSGDCLILSQTDHAYQNYLSNKGN